MGADHITRRRFLYSTGTLAGAIAFGGCARQKTARPRAISPNEKLNIGMIGGGGKAVENLKGVSSENIVAICDVDQVRAAEGFKLAPQAKRYRDFRKMLESEKSLDAVVVTTPDHTHAVAAVTAMKLGKHVYCEKPLAHSIHEARIMRDVARQHKVATQMGNQGHAYESTRRVVELVRAGALGAVREVHVWTDRPIWPQGLDRPTETKPIPASLDWDLWLGPARYRPYNAAYLPFNWRGWWDFGTGALGDMACHCWDTAYWALDLGVPETAEAESSGANAETAPKWSIIQYQFPARKARGPVKLTWYDGGKLPNTDLIGGAEYPKNGSLIVGEKGSIAMKDWNADRFQLLPAEKFKDYPQPPQTIRRSPGVYKEWIAACKGGPATMSNFDYASELTEAVLLGNVALRMGKRVEWDARNMRAKGAPEADAYIRAEYRQGWSL